MTGLSSFLVNPLMLVIGTALVAAPILIHLLNKRKFQLVDWAAMDFLLEADEQNRRRLRLENLLLLLLRCLAIFLIGLLLARPFSCSRLLPGGRDRGQYERIVMIDDSLSMQVRTGNGSALDDAKERLIELVRGFANNRSDDALTLLLTSRPDRPLLNSRSVTDKTIDEVLEAIRGIEAVDTSANFELALGEVQHQAAAGDVLQKIIDQTKNIDRVFYLFTDLRRRDWQAPVGRERESGPAGLLRDMSKELSGCFLIDVGRQRQANLAVTEIRPHEMLITGVASRFDVTVANQGQREVRDVKVNFYAGQSLPLQTSIEKIAAGGVETVAFAFQHVDPVRNRKPAGVAIESLQVRAEAIAPTAYDVDLLEADSQRYYAARVVRGIPVLVVDGDPAADSRNSESFFLAPALSPPGEARSGLLVKVVTETELENIELRDFQVVFLCNVYRLSQTRLESLQKWTAAGGGLVIMPGDQVDEEYFNKWLFREGKGLSPIGLNEIRGDQSKQNWVQFKIEEANHPVLRMFAGEVNKPLLEKIKVFRWWRAEVAQQSGTVITAPVRLTDVDDSPLLVEKAFGEGRVLATTVPADDAWSNWADLPSYFITMQLLAPYMAGDLTGQSDVRVGQPLRQPLDLALYQRSATLLQPGNRKVSAEAAPDEPANSPRGEAETKQAIWQIEHADTTKSGYYTFELTRKEGGSEHVMYAANIDPQEGDLRRADLEKLERELDGGKVKLVVGESISPADVRGSRREWWKQVWLLLLIVLCVEMVCGWWFGRRR